MNAKTKREIVETLKTQGRRDLARLVQAADLGKLAGDAAKKLDAAEDLLIDVSTMVKRLPGTMKIQKQLNQLRAQIMSIMADIEDIGT